MAEHQGRIKELIAELWALVAGCSSKEVTEEAVLFRSFFSTVWVKLAGCGENGAALATASCIPLWEMLNCVASTFSSLDAIPKARMVQMLTAMYPKSKDRRSTYQQLTKYASKIGTAVPLSTDTPCMTESTVFLAGTGKLPKALKDVDIDNVDIDSGDSAEKMKIAAAVKTLVERVLPSTVIVGGQKRGSFSAVCGNEALGPVEVLMSVVWKCLVFAELGDIPEKRQLSQYLVSSGWSSKAVEQSEPRITYASLFAPLTTMCMVCLSCNSLTPSVSADSIPLFDPHIAQSVLEEERCLATVADQLSASKKARVCATKVSLPSLSTGERSREDTVKKLTSEVPEEVAFMGTSSSCRDCDRLTILCRDILFSTLSTERVPAETGTSLIHTALFSRKRSREGGSLSEAPSFTPIASSISDMLSDQKDSERNTLERLALSWQGK